MTDDQKPQQKTTIDPWAEMLRLRDVLMAEKRKAELQAGLLLRLRGPEDQFTQEAERRLDRLAEALKDTMP